MLRRYPLVVPLTFALSACGSNSGPTEGTPPATAGTDALVMPAVPDGYTRLVAPTFHNIAPGADVTHCQYAMVPFDHDVDVLDVTGAQSHYGHHGVAFSYVPAATDSVGSEVTCIMDNTEYSAGAASGGSFLGAVGPKAGRTISLPSGVAFRLKQGQGIVLNLHYINTSDKPVDGQAYLDLKFADVDPNRPIGALFLNLNVGFSLPPGQATDSNADCVAQSDVNILMMSDHVHEYGIHAKTEVVHVDTGATEVIRDDPTWTADMVNNPTFSKWDLASPFVLHTGDTIRTSCSWDNTTADTLAFPREMCISAGFALASGDNPKAPACFNGNWIAQGI